jgi:hypothetical protein
MSFSITKPSSTRREIICIGPPLDFFLTARELEEARNRCPEQSRRLLPTIRNGSKTMLTDALQWPGRRQ